MYVTNGNLGDVKKWFYDKENHYTWLGMFLPSVQDQHLLKEIIESVDNLDRLTRGNVALMTFLTSEIDQGREFLLRDKTHNLNTNYTKYENERLALTWGGGCVLNIQFSLLHTIRNQYNPKLEWYIDDHIKRDTTHIADNLRKELNLDSQKSYLLLLCRYGDKDDYLKIPVNDNLNCNEIFELFTPFWSSISNVECLKKRMDRIVSEIELHETRFNNAINNLPSLSEIMPLFTNNINNYIEKTLNINKASSVKESDISLRGKYIIIHGKKIMQYKLNRKKLARIVNEHNWRKNQAIVRDHIEAKHTNLTKEYERIIEQFNKTERLVKNASTRINKSRLKKTWLTFMHNVFSDLSVKFIESITKP